MCLNYITDESCRDCVKTALQDILKLCPNSREAAVWEEDCQLRYSNQNFFGKLNTAENIGLDNAQDVSQPEQFKSVVKETLNNLTLKAAFNLSTDMHATGEAAFDGKTIYALLQCTRDLSPDGCNSCLQIAITNILTCCYFSVGARLLSRSCFLRYELYNFYGGVSKSPSSTNAQGGRKKEIIAQQATIGDSCIIEFHPHSFRGRNDLKAPDFPYIDLVSLQVATNNFSDSNKLGQGGFGPVYKGIMSDGKEVAVKRFSYCSEQGSEEFTNVVLLRMKLQHKNLVRLLGFCLDREEKILVYEFMPNSSLDVFLFS
ncbi:Cysteine-rich receptor-like protein kinase 25 [Morella rubra]|uniref:Cysteine-rich receptor-like protein kinase 25 n=1 Tax=Morella rubra TaxID=262757 RepID=A0A6A1UMB5_9ROSI|nr:Cysteine-rich receptor-like protein kinase 25 [Morella rubra]